MANNKNITFDQLQSSMTKIKGELNKKANNNHGIHVEYYDDDPKVAGILTAGSSNRLSRGDHVHPAQTTITGNAGTATTLATARTLTIGNTGKSFDGSANVSWNLSEIGAQPANSLTTKTVSNRILTLGTELYQYAAITSNNTIINLPSVSSFTEIHLFFDWSSGISIIMPSNVKWQEGVMYGPGHTHEFIFTYVNSTIGWLGGCIVYG